jgi:hypothetical protein
MSVTSRNAGFSHFPCLWAGVAQWAARRLPGKWRLLRQAVTIDGRVLATLGPVQVRRMRACIIARTFVRGERLAALQIALGRLADYVGGDNREGRPLQAAKPVVQRLDSPGKWLVQISLRSEYTQFSPPVPRNHKVRILAQPIETLAIIRLRGNPRWPALAGGQAAILAAIADSGWIASGTPLLRLHTQPGLLPWSGGFELAVPVTAA